MKLRLTSVTIVLVLAGCSDAGSPPAERTQATESAVSVAAAGVAYVHAVARSRFDVGPGARIEAEGPISRVVGDNGVFATDQVTGATLAIRNAVPAKNYPKGLTNDPTSHSAAVKSYLLAAGIPANEVSGTHVTTTMAGGGPVASGVQPLQSQLLWYTTHLERSLGGVPVEGSFAYAALDTAGQPISEGVYWPAIPAATVAEAQALKAKLGSAAARSAYLAKVTAAQPDVGGEGCEVKIVHTGAGYGGAFDAKAVCSGIARSAAGGKPRIVRFDETGAQTAMADERHSSADSVKQQ